VGPTHGLQTPPRRAPARNYTATNNAAANEILVFDRSANGALTLADAFATGGLGSGDGLGNQGGITMTGDGRFLLVVNAGSNDISVLETTGDGLALRDRQPSGGLRPVSVTANRRLVSVLNAGGAAGGPTRWSASDCHAIARSR
jgi:6-phosphogluconolactonase (cycloisomerase 2 family)